MSTQTNRPELEFDLLDRLHKSLRISGKGSSALADELGVHRNTIANYMSGRTPIDRRTLIAWAMSTGVPLEWLEHGVTSTNDDPDGASVTISYPKSGTLLAFPSAA